MTPSSPAPSKRVPLQGERAVDGHWRHVEWRLAVARDARAATAVRFAPGDRPRPSTASRSKATNDAGVSFASVRRVTAAGEALRKRVEREPARRGDDDLAVKDAAARQVREEQVVQVRKVAVERLLSRLWMWTSRASRKTIARKPSHFGSKEKGPPRRGRLGEFGQHRLYRGLNGKSHERILSSKLNRPASSRPKAKLIRLASSKPTPKVIQGRPEDSAPWRALKLSSLAIFELWL